MHVTTYDYIYISNQNVHGIGKVLEISFKTLSIGILEYPDGSCKMVWLPDATVKYLSGKHIPLFIAAVLILLIGLVYTALLFSWQWLLCLPKWKIFLWSRDVGEIIGGSMRRWKEVCPVPVVHVL